ncbi:MAG: hypothetical protein RL662_393 [Bacteroidota bacterium]|jgi:hypothetical protein
MKIIFASILFFLNLLNLSFCSDQKKTHVGDNQNIDTLQSVVADTLVKAAVDTLSMDDIVIEKQLRYDQYTLEDEYPYKDKVRKFQWDKVRDRLAYLETIQQKRSKWAVVQNYRNGNGEAPLVRAYKRNAYKRVADTFGVERYQSVPLYLRGDSVPARYIRDGSLVKYIGDSVNFVHVETTFFAGEWMIPKKYLKTISDSVIFNKAVFVDVTNQNITTLEKNASKWLIRSMNPATTGMYKPPYAQETPLGLFVVQEKKAKMLFLVDGTTETGGFAPWASRFTNGAYIHGIPVNAPRTTNIEFSPSLGTIPRSHMCVRNASSHAKFVYDWITFLNTIVFIID